jgi:hypothetical protein
MTFIDDVAEVLEIRNIGQNAISEGLEEMITEAEEVDIRQFLGAILYKDFKDNKVDDKYVKLLDGTSYTIGSDTVDYPGIKKAILHFGLARWYVERSLRPTRTGLVGKETDFSSRASDKALAEKVEQEKSVATYYLAEATKYLCNNTDLYPLYDGSDIRKVHKSQITPIG